MLNFASKIEIRTIMNEINYFFQASPIYNILALTTTFVGTLYGIASFIIGSRKRIPTYAIRTTHLIREITNNNENVKITYKGKEFPNLSSTRFVFWNQGRLTIKKDDVATKNPIKIAIADNYQILDAFIDKQTDEDNNFILNLSPDNKSITIKFEYLEYHDGVAIQIIHTAPSSQELVVSGKVISGGKIHNAHSNSFIKGLIKIIDFLGLRFLSFRYRLSIYRVFLFLFGVIMILNPLLTQYKTYENLLFANSNSIWYYIFIYPMGVLYMLFALFALKRHIPKELES